MQFNSAKQNFANAASFAHRLLDLPELSTEKHADLKGKALKVLQKSEREGRNEFTIDYDERNPFRYYRFLNKFVVLIVLLLLVSIVIG